MNYLLPTEKFTITHTLTDGEEDLGIRAKVIDNELVDVTNTLFGSAVVDLTHVVGGTYGFKHTAGIIKGHYTVQYSIYEDGTYSELSEKYGIIEEKVRVIDIVAEVLAGIPDNILLDDDTRLDNLADIQNLALETTLTNAESNIISSVENVIDDSDGKAV